MARVRRRAPDRIAGMLAHTELSSTDPDATRRFLADVFGWKFKTVKTASRKMIEYQTPGGTRGSIRPTRLRENPGSVNYVLVDDLDSSASRIKKAGGRIILPRVDIPGMGGFFWFKLPGGPVLACWQDAPEEDRTS